MIQWDLWWIKTVNVDIQDVFKDQLSDRISSEVSTQSVQLYNTLTNLSAHKWISSLFSVFQHMNGILFRKGTHLTQYVLLCTRMIFWYINKPCCFPVHERVTLSTVMCILSSKTNYVYTENNLYVINLIMTNIIMYYYKGSAYMSSGFETRLT